MFIELLEMSCRNFLSIGNRRETFGFNKNCITVFKGDIGAGKSTIADALSVLLFGKTYSGKNITSIINWTNKKNCELSLTLRLSGIKYEIVRNFKPDSYALFVYNGDTKTNIELSNKDDLTTKIIELLKIDRKIFDQTVFLSQRQYEPFMEMSLSNKRDFIKRIFSLEKYDVMKDEVNADIKTLEKEVEQLNGKLEVYETQISTKEESIITQEKEHLESLASMEAEIEGLKSKIIDIPDFDDIGLNTLSSELNSITTKIELKKQEIKTAEELWKKYNDNKLTIENNKVKIEEKRKLLDPSIDISKKDFLLEKAVGLKSDYDYAMKNFEDYKKAKSKIFDYRVDQIDDIDSQVKTLETEVVDLSKELSKIENENLISETTKKTLEKSIQYYSGAKDVCSEYGKPITTEEKSQKVREFTDLIAKLEFKDVRTLKDSIATRTTSISSMNEIIKYLIYFKTFDANKIENMETIRKEFNSTKETLDKIVQNKTLSDEIADLNKEIELTSINTPEVSVSSLYEELEVLSTNFTTTEKVVKDLKEKKQEIEDLKKAKEKSTQEVNTKETLLKREKELFATSQKNITKEISVLKETNNSILVSKGEKEAEVDILSKIILTLGDNGVKKYIIGRYLQVLNQIANKYLTTFNCQFSVVFNNSKGLSCDIFKRGEEVPYENLSNGQSQQVNLAILFTFIEFLKIKNASNFPLIFLDEMFDGSMSPDALREVVKGISMNIPYVNIITHREQNFEMADVLIDVKYDGRFSRYEKVYDTTDIGEIKTEQEINISEELF